MQIVAQVFSFFPNFRKSQYISSSRSCGLSQIWRIENGEAWGGGRTRSSCTGSLHFTCFKFHFSVAIFKAECNIQCSVQLTCLFVRLWIIWSVGKTNSSWASQGVHSPQLCQGGCWRIRQWTDFREESQCHLQCQWARTHRGMNGKRTESWRAVIPWSGICCDKTSYLCRWQFRPTGVCIAVCTSGFC